MSFKAPLQCLLPLTSLLLGLGASSASAIEGKAVRPFTLAQAPDQTPPSPGKEKPDEAAKKHPEQDKAKADAQKQQQLQQDKAKSEAQKQQQLQQDKAKAEGQKQQLEQDRTKAETNQQKQLEQEKAKTEALKSKQPDQAQQPVTENNPKAVEQVRQDRAKADDAFAKAKEEARKEREQAKTTGAEPEDKAHEQHRVVQEKKFEDLRQQRQERVEDGGRRVVIEEPDKRRIIREEGKTIIRHDETERFRHSYGEVRTERRGDLNVNVVVRPGGAQIFTDLDDEGHPLRRYRRDPDGREFVFFDNRDYYRRARPHTFLDAIIDLAPPVISIPRERYIVDYERASDDDIYDALSAPPVEHMDRTYSLEEVRYSGYLRDRMPRVDLDTLTFDFGSWEVDPYQYEKLERVAHVINRILDRHPEEMFLIEGHTDAVGSDDDNLSLSDRRAEAVAEVLTKEFNIPAENLTTQGYGEQFLKVDTPGPERVNRRVAIRRITPLISRSDQSQYDRHRWNTNG
jgi:outer membrane protein OmpA-like peptidoglycan-associated protein